MKTPSPYYMALPMVDSTSFFFKVIHNPLIDLNTTTCYTVFIRVDNLINKLITNYK